MDKPDGKSFKKWVVGKIAVDSVVDERVVSMVVSHQFEKMREAMNNSFSVELSGFGRFYFNRKKAGKRIEKYKELIGNLNEMVHDENSSDAKRANAQFKLGIMIGDLKTLERKLDDGN